MMDNDLWDVVYAAFLHDIGKFRLRAGLKGLEVSTGEVKSIHEAHSFVFIRDCLPEKIVNKEVVLYLVGKHHNRLEEVLPRINISEVFVNIIKDSDQLSAAEREPEDFARDLYQPLISILTKVELDKKSNDIGYFSIDPLRLEKDVLFPKRREEARCSEVAYKKLWSMFENECKKIGELANYLSSEKFFTVLYYLLLKYTFFIPSAVYETVPDISLFEHLKNSAAIAACLYYRRVKEKVSGGNEFLLVYGDISGIQRFIYTITSRGALKGLKGRSAYISFLTEAVAKHIIVELGLPLTNIIYCSGGHFLILAPNTGRAKETLKKVIKDVNKWLVEAFAGNLYFAIDYVECSAEDIRKKITSKMDEVKLKVALKKQRKFSEIVLDAYNKVFEMEDVRPEYARCEICGSYRKVEVRDDVRMCEFCRDVDLLGGKLRNAKYIVEIICGKDESPFIEEREFEGIYRFPRFGIYFYVTYSYDELVTFLKIIKKGVKIALYVLNDTDFLSDDLIRISKDYGAPLGFKFIATSTPVKNGKIMSFDELAKESKGAHYIGVLKMDVDNLGRVFSEGLREEERTFSRISTLSSLLSLFFEGYVNKICEESVVTDNYRERFKDKVYAIYSGGDDLLIIGAWSYIFELAFKLSEEFKEYVMSNPNLTVSGAVSIVHPKYPVYLFSDEVSNLLEEKAKKKPGKNSLAMFGEAFYWDNARSVKQLKDEIVRMVEKGKNGKTVSRSFIQRLFDLYYVYDRLESTAIFRERLHYMLGRYKEMYKDFESELENIKPLILEHMCWLNVPARWAELETRKEVGGSEFSD